jgi:hypothetical protein
MRMATRRGLVVTSVVKRLLKQYGLGKDWNEVKFIDWWHTPYVMGGFGGGRKGRTELRMTTIMDKKIQVRTIVTGISHKGEKWIQAAKVRAEGALPMPGMRTKIEWSKVAGVTPMAKLRADRFQEEARMKVDWTVEDLAVYSDAYERKLILEWKLRKGEEILESDLPRVFNLGENVDRVYRRYRKLISEVKGIDETSTSGESHYKMTAWTNEVWSGICMRSARWGKEAPLLPLMHLVHEKMMETVYRRGLTRVLV